MDGDTRFEEPIIMTILPRGCGAGESDSSTTVHWIGQDGDGECPGYAEYAEHLSAKDALKLVERRKSDVLLSVIDCRKGENLGTVGQVKELTWLALQAGAAFGKIPDTVSNIIIVPGDHEGIRRARHLIIMGAPILYTNVDVFEHVPMIVPFDSFVPAGELPEELAVSPGDIVDFEAGNFRYVGEIPGNARPYLLRCELEHVNFANLFSLGVDFNILPALDGDLMAFLSFWLEKIRGVGSFPHVNTGFFYSIPLSSRRQWTAYPIFHQAACRAAEVFSLWQIGNKLSIRETGRGFFGASDEEELEGNAEIIQCKETGRKWGFWHKHAEEFGIREMVTAYYSGVPYDDIIGGAGRETGIMIHESGYRAAPLIY